MSYLFGLFIEECASEEDGGALLHRECLMVATTRAECEEYAEITDFAASLTSRIYFVVKAVEVSERQYAAVSAPEPYIYGESGEPTDMFYGEG